MDKDLADSQAERQGRIVIGVERCVAEKLPKSEPRNVQSFYKPTATVDFAKDVFKERHIRQAMMFVLSQPQTPKRHTKSSE